MAGATAGAESLQIDTLNGGGGAISREDADHPLELNGTMRPFGLTGSSGARSSSGPHVLWVGYYPVLGRLVSQEFTAAGPFWIELGWIRATPAPAQDTHGVGPGRNDDRWRKDCRLEEATRIP